jgi:hypothetical protein
MELKQLSLQDHNIHEKEDLNSFKIEKTNTVPSRCGSGAITNRTKSSQFTYQEGKKIKEIKQTQKEKKIIVKTEMTVK